MEYRWFAVQTTAGHENKVRMLLQRRIEEDPRPAEQKLVRQALVPVQEAIEIKNGKKVVVERKLYPGYVLIETTMSQEAQHLVNSVQGVIGSIWQWMTTASNWVRILEYIGGALLIYLGLILLVLLTVGAYWLAGYVLERNWQTPFLPFPVPRDFTVTLATWLPTLPGKP